MNKQELICELNSQKDKPTVNYFTLEKREGYQEGMRIAKFIAEKLDEPQKVNVSDEFDMWYKEIKTRWVNESSAKHFALLKICQYGFGCGFEDVNGNRTSNTLSDWVCFHKNEAINAVWNGYEVEEEPKYYVKEPITGQFLVRDEAQSNGVKWVDGFSTHPSYYTEAEIEAIEPSYLLFKIPVEKVEE